MPDKKGQLTWLGQILWYEFLGYGRFLGVGGVTELAYTIFALTTAAIIFTHPETLWETEALRGFVYLQVPHQGIAIIPALAGISSLVGSAIGWRRGATLTSRLLRSAGCIMQFVILLFLAAMTGKTAGLAIISQVLYWVGVVLLFKVCVLIWVDQS